MSSHKVQLCLVMCCTDLRATCLLTLVSYPHPVRMKDGSLVIVSCLSTAAAKAGYMPPHPIVQAHLRGTMSDEQDTVLSRGIWG
jgi:hypothetical protein